MIRTQIYLPEELHKDLSKLAALEKTSLSNLIRHGANLVVKKKASKHKNAQQQALKFWANPPRKYKLNLTGRQLIELTSADRDE